MAAPSWLPTWPTNWPDFVEEYVGTVPRAWPKRLFKRGGSAYADLQAIGECLSVSRQLLEFALRGFLPPADVFGLFMHFWESDFGVVPAATLADRRANLARRARLLNQSSATDVIKAVFSDVFGVDPSALSITHVSQADLAANNTLGDVTAARYNNSYHVYPTDEDVDPDYDMGDSAVAELEPVVGRITFGRYLGLKWGRSPWGRACWTGGA